jgi:hypothetical protein
LFILNIFLKINSALARKTSIAGLSLGPSDSISQPEGAGSATNKVNSGGAVRPESYPRSVLWNIEDCQYYGIVTEKNASRPPMEKCVRNNQGETISTSEYNAIKTTARMLVNIHLVPLGTPADPAAKTKTKTKTYYKKYFLQNFKDVLDKLEAQEPVLTLCAARWKAEHIIANCLTAIVDCEKAAKKKDAAARGEESDDDGLLDAQPAKRQRTNERELGSRKKKRRSRGESANGSKGVKIFRCDLNFSQLSTHHSPAINFKSWDSWPNHPIIRTTGSSWATKKCQPHCSCRCKHVHHAKSKSSYHWQCAER